MGSFWKKAKNVGKWLLNPTSVPNLLGDVADKIADKTGLGDKMADSTIGKIANYTLNPIAQTQGARDLSNPVVDWAEEHPQVVKTIGNGLQIVGGGVACIFPPAGAIIAGVGTGVVIAGNAMAAKKAAEQFPDYCKLFKSALADKDYKKCLLCLSYMLSQGADISSELSQLKISAKNDGRFAELADTLNRLSITAYTTEQVIENAENLYSEIYADFVGSNNDSSVTEVVIDESGEIMPNVTKLTAFGAFLLWFFEGLTIKV